MIHNNRKQNRLLYGVVSYLAVATLIVLNPLQLISGLLEKFVEEKRKKSLADNCKKKLGFSLLELLLVIATLSVLSALLFPVFNTVRGRARQSVCQSNLKQMGAAVSMYMQDYDGLYPYAIDPQDRETIEVWSAYPDFQARIPEMKLVQDVLLPYTHSPQLFRCPSDTGFTVDDFTGIPLDATPTSYEKFGTSYYYRTEVAQKRASESLIEFPSKINLLFDGAGQWHGSLLPLTRRHNVLFADGHIKSLTHEDLREAWATPLNPTTEDVEED